MPQEHQTFDSSWPARRLAWFNHYLTKGASEQKAGQLADKKQFKTSMPVSP